MYQNKAAQRQYKKRLISQTKDTPLLVEADGTEVTDSKLSQNSPIFKSLILVSFWWNLHDFEILLVL